MKNILRSKSLVTIFSCTFLIQCGVFVGNPTDSDGDGTSDYSTPLDSSGTDASLALSFSSDSSATLQGSDLQLPNGLVIKNGELAFSRLKLSPYRDIQSAESEFDTRIKSKETEEEAEKALARKAKQEEIFAIETQYDAIIADADDKEQARLDEDDARQALELELAELEKEREDELDQIDNEDRTLKLTDTYSYDLLTRTLEPSLSGITAKDGSYNRIELELRPNRDTDAGDMINRAALVEGDIEINGVTRRVEFEIRQAITLRLRADKSLAIDPDDANELIIKFRIGKWFQGVDFATAILNSRGEIHINERKNKGLFSDIVANIRRTTEFGEDADNDGDLGGEEFAGDGDYVDGEYDDFDDLFEGESDEEIAIRSLYDEDDQDGDEEFELKKKDSHKSKHH